MAGFIPDYYTDEEFKQRCYELYQLEWMGDMGYSIRDVMNIIQEYMIEDTINGTMDSDMTIATNEAIDHFLYEDGFNGNLFVCKDEFLTHEFLNEEYMSELLYGTTLERWRRMVE